MTNLSALYLSLKRISELVPLPHTWGATTIGAVPTNQMQRVALTAALETSILQYLAQSSVPTLGQLLIDGQLTQGSLFTHLGLVYGRGIAGGAVRHLHGKPITKEPVLWAKLDSYRPGTTISLTAHPENYTSVSSVIELAKQHRLFILGRITSPEPPEIRAQAYVVGYLYPGDRPSPLPDRFDLLAQHMELSMSLIDSFGLPDTWPRTTPKELARLKDIPETQIKHAFAEIIGESFVPKDWGGERSDLVTSRLRIQGKSVVAAFAFKGPSKFKPLTVADLGKPGDQISRLFTEPADICILQHCHHITSAVRDHMRAFATRTNRLRPFCLIDGSDTVVILKANQKLGFAG